MINNKEEIFKKKEDVRACKRVKTREKVLIYTVARSRKPRERRKLGDRTIKS